LARADAWINPPKQQDNPFRSLLIIIRSVFDLFWLTWKDRRDKRRRSHEDARRRNKANEDTAV
ncbi:MAG: hypothetical protein E7A34_14975, partial [Leclercia adecarboxylata]|nr:hypothetical protein [Leclercia adecarboxylata]